MINSSHKFIIILNLLLCALISGCVSTPPKKQDNLCDIFDEKRGWYKHAKKASKKWNIPIASNMAIMHQESRFVSKARPPRKKFLWIFPGARASSAYGYSQAKTTTWKWYIKESGNRGADRDKFKDAIDFIGWYNNTTTKRNKVSRYNTYGLYLAYHEGHGGYNRKTFNKKKWLIGVAKKVDARSKRYAAQLKKCEGRMQSSWWPF